MLDGTHSRATGKERIKALLPTGRIVEDLWRVNSMMKSQAGKK